MSQPNILGTLVDPEQTYLAIQLSWSNSYLFPLEQGLDFVRSLAQAVHLEDVTDLKPSNNKTSVRIDIVHGCDIKEEALKTVLGVAA